MGTQMGPKVAMQWEVGDANTMTVALGVNHVDACPGDQGVRSSRYSDLWRTPNFG